MALFLGNNAGTTVTAEIVEGSNDVISASDNKGAFRRHIESQVIPNLWNIADMSRDLPMRFKDCRLLQLEQGFAMISPCGQTPAIPNVLLVGTRQHDLTPFELAYL